jgi:hypothetical protein
MPRRFFPRPLGFTYILYITQHYFVIVDRLFRFAKHRNWMLRKSCTVIRTTIPTPAG